MNAFKISVVAGLSALTLTACSGASDNAASDDVMVQDETNAPAQDAGTAAEAENIVQLAQATPDLSTLVAAVTAAGLGETLSATGPFTVFAPTNAAFAKVDKATLDGLMKPESKDKLAALLKYHVVSGNVKAADVAKMITDGKGIATIKTVAGGSLKASMDGSKVILTDAKGGKSTITGADVAASNGVVHMIDTVVMP